MFALFLSAPRRNLTSIFLQPLPPPPLKKQKQNPVRPCPGLLRFRPRARGKALRQGRSGAGPETGGGRRPGLPGTPRLLRRDLQGVLAAVPRGRLLLGSPGFENQRDVPGAREGAGRVGRGEGGGDEGRDGGRGQGCGPQGGGGPASAPPSPPPALARPLGAQLYFLNRRTGVLCTHCYTFEGEKEKEWTAIRKQESLSLSLSRRSRSRRWRRRPVAAAPARPPPSSPAPTSSSSSAAIVALPAVRVRVGPLPEGPVAVEDAAL